MHPAIWLTTSARMTWGVVAVREMGVATTLGIAIGAAVGSTASGRRLAATLRDSLAEADEGDMRP